MNFRTTIILGVVLVVGAGALWLFSTSLQPPADTTPLETSTADPGEGERLVDASVTPSSVTRIELRRPGKPNVVFEAGAESSPMPRSWRMVQPFEAGADPAAVTRIVRAALALRSHSKFEEGKGVSAEAAGLAPPRAEVLLSVGAATPIAFQLGEKLPMSDDRYVRRGDSPNKTIHAASGSGVDPSAGDLLAEATRELAEYRSKKITSVTSAKVNELRLVHDGRTIQLERGPRGWSLTAPVRAAADEARVRVLLDSFAGLNALEFVKTEGVNEAAFGFDAPFLRVAAVAAASTPATQPGSATQPASVTQPGPDSPELIVGAAGLKPDTRYARLAGEPGVFVLSKADVDRLTPDLAKLRDPRVTRLSAGDITGLALQIDGETAQLRREDNEWRGQDALAELDSTAVTDLVQALTELRAVDFIAEPRDELTGLDKPRAILRAEAKPGGVLAVRIGAAAPGGRNAYAAVEGEPGALLISAEAANRFAAPLISLLPRTIFDLDPASILELNVQRPPMTYALRGADNELELTAPPGAPLDAGAAQSLVGDLARLRAKRVVARQDSGEYGLGQPVATLRFTAAARLAGPAGSPPATQAARIGGDRTHTLRIGRAGNVAYAQRDEDPQVFELEESTFRSLTGELLKRDLFTFRAADVSALSIVSTGGSLEFVKEGNAWKYALEPSTQLGQAKVKELMEALAKLRAEQFLGYGDAGAAEHFADAPVTITITLAGGTAQVLRLAPPASGELPRMGFLAEGGRVFLLKAEDVAKLLRGLSDYLPPAPHEMDEPAAGFTQQP